MCRQEPHAIYDAATVLHSDTTSVAQNSPGADLDRIEGHTGQFLDLSMPIMTHDEFYQ